jgi:hypothetical protein
LCKLFSGLDSSGQLTLTTRKRLNSSVGRFLFPKNWTSFILCSYSSAKLTVIFDPAPFTDKEYPGQDLRSLPSRKLNEAELELSTPFISIF